MLQCRARWPNGPVTQSAFSKLLSFINAGMFEESGCQTWTFEISDICMRITMHNVGLCRNIAGPILTPRKLMLQEVHVFAKYALYYTIIIYYEQNVVSLANY